MIPSTLKTIFLDGEVDDSSLLIDFHHPYREKDLLTNQFDDIEDDLNDQNSPFFGLFPPASNTLLGNCSSHESSGSSSNGSSSAFSFSDSAYASSQSPPPINAASNISSQSIFIMRNYSAPSNPQQNQQNPNPKVSTTTTTINRSLFTGLPTNSSDSSSSSVHSNVDHPYGLSSALTQKYPENIFNCFMCQDLSKDDRARVLPCFHSFCESCIEKLTDIDKETITCPNCAFSSTLAEILPDYTRLNNPSTMTENYMVALSSDAYAQYCTACKTSESMAVAKCFQCSTFLCHQCVCAHQIMNCFEGHRVVHIKELDSNGNDLRLIYCPVHKNEILKFFCVTCNTPICSTCSNTEHGRPGHEFVTLNDGSHHVAKLQNLVENTRQRLMELKQAQKNSDRLYSSLQAQYNKARNDINETYNFYRQLIEERKHDLIKELDAIFSERQNLLTNQIQKLDEIIERANLPLEFSDRLFKSSSTTEILMFKKQLENRFSALHQPIVEINGQLPFELEFVSNFQAMQTGVRNTFGYVRSSIVEPNSSNHFYKTKTNKLNNENFSKVIGSPTSNNCQTYHHQSQQNSNKSSQLAVNQNHSLLNGIDLGPCNLSQSSLNKFTSLTPSSPTPMSFNLTGNSIDMHPYEIWSNGNPISSVNNQQNLSNSLNSSNGLTNLTGQDQNGEMANENLSSLDGFSPLGQHLPMASRSNSSTLKRQKMIYHQKFGEFGVLEGQFTEPSGVAVNSQGDIIVADTNNHRIQVFDSNGRFRFQFGECGKRDGQLLYPNRVAVYRQTGDIVVTERSPTHQIQIYNQFGNFIRKFGANVLQHPRGVCVDNMGRIIVVECKVMRVFIFDMNGNVLNKFTCSKYLEFPNGVCCNDKQEIFISDNRAHCIKVFSYDGQFLRTIGSEGVTNYPIGVVQNSQGDVLIADNHNNFNLTIFSQDGQLINALESKVKHAQCFDVALMDDGSVVLASKDYRIYIYRYLMSSSSISMNGQNGSPSSPVSSSSTTPNNGQLLAGECLSPSLINGQAESPSNMY